VKRLSDSSAGQVATSSARCMKSRPVPSARRRHRRAPQRPYSGEWRLAMPRSLLEDRRARLTESRSAPARAVLSQGRFVCAMDTRRKSTNPFRIDTSFGRSSRDLAKGSLVRRPYSSNPLAARRSAVSRVLECGAANERESRFVGQPRRKQQNFHDGGLSSIAAAASRWHSLQAASSLFPPSGGCRQAPGHGDAHSASVIPLAMSICSDERRRTSPKGFRARRHRIGSGRLDRIRKSERERRRNRSAGELGLVAREGCRLVSKQ